jgi:hypothetical protein
MRASALFQRRACGGLLVQQALQFSLVLATLGLAAYLRIAGLMWGLDSGYGHDLNFQPDEFVSLRGVLQLDLLTGRIKAPGAYFEGTFNYYLWAIPQAASKLLGNRTPNPGGAGNTPDQSELLYICRWMSVLFDLCTLVVVFVAIREATQRFYASLVGALCYAVLPMQVIYSHFMRTHILSNLLCALVIWGSLKLQKSQPWQLLVTVGLLSGLGAATRYPVGLIVVVPCLCLLLSDTGDPSVTRHLRFLQRAKHLISWQVWLIGFGFVIGLFIGHPMLFLDPSSVTNAITNETLKYASLQQFSTTQLLNLSVVWRYIVYLIPYAMYPLLWLAPYSAIVYLFLRSRLYSQSVPLMMFSALYLYFMAKGYLGPYFARATMLLFPGFCILVGIASADLQLRLNNKRILAVSFTAAILLAFAPSVMFDIAYDRAMQRKDAREALREDLQMLIGGSPATIGMLRFGPYFYTVAPAVEPLKSEHVTVELQDVGDGADFFLVGFPRAIDLRWTNATVARIEAESELKYEKTYRVPVKILGYEFSLVQFPVDMTYPFPTILLFRKRVAPLG